MRISPKEALRLCRWWNIILEAGEDDDDAAEASLVKRLEAFAVCEPMTNAQLIAELQKLPPDALAVVASDAEGNSFDTISQVTLGDYNKEEREFSDNEGEVEGVKAVCIWP